MGSVVDEVELARLGPLKHLVGDWEGDKGSDVAPADDRGVERNAYRERMSFVPIGEVANHEQRLHGLRYATTAWRHGETSAFHEELGYWLWDPHDLQVLRCFVVPRGITVIAGGTAAQDATDFELEANLGSETYGICSNRFLDREFKTVRYELRITVHDADTFSYEEDTQLLLRDREDLFHHRDANTLRRVPAGPA
ncbi:MAG: heme-binding beta-barrel domain-containing protein [Pseudomonadales bacterium]